MFIVRTQFGNILARIAPLITVWLALRRLSFDCGDGKGGARKGSPKKVRLPDEASLGTILGLLGLSNPTTERGITLRSRIEGLYEKALGEIISSYGELRTVLNSIASIIFEEQLAAMAEIGGKPFEIDTLGGELTKRIEGICRNWWDDLEQAGETNEAANLKTALAGLDHAPLAQIIARYLEVEETAMRWYVPKALGMLAELNGSLRVPEDGDGECIVEWALSTEDGAYIQAPTMKRVVDGYRAVRDMREARRAAQLVVELVTREATLVEKLQQLGGKATASLTLQSRIELAKERISMLQGVLDRTAVQNHKEVHLADVWGAAFRVAIQKGVPHRLQALKEIRGIPNGNVDQYLAALAGIEERRQELIRLPNATRQQHPNPHKGSSKNGKQQSGTKGQGDDRKAPTPATTKPTAAMLEELALIQQLGEKIGPRDRSPRINAAWAEPAIKARLDFLGGKLRKEKPPIRRMFMDPSGAYVTFTDPQEKVIEKPLSVVKGQIVNPAKAKATDEHTKLAVVKTYNAALMTAARKAGCSEPRVRQLSASMDRLLRVAVRRCRDLEDLIHRAGGSYPKLPADYEMIEQELFQKADKAAKSEPKPAAAKPANDAVTEPTVNVELDSSGPPAGAPLN